MASETAPSEKYLAIMGDLPAKTQEMVRATADGLETPVRSGISPRNMAVTANIDTGPEATKEKSHALLNVSGVVPTQIADANIGHGVNMPKQQEQSVGRIV